jgi:hypothetical protein
VALNPIVDYDTLLAAAAAWIDRADMADVLPLCVGFATSRFNELLRVNAMVRRSRTTVTVPAEYVDLPDDFLELKSAVPVSSPPSPPLTLLTLDQLKMAEYERASRFPTPPTVPAYFCIVGNEIAVGPSSALGTGGGTYSLDIVYYGAIPELSPASPTNWLIQRKPLLYLAQTLVETAPYLRDDDRVAVWQTMADRSIGELIAQDNRAKEMGGAMAPRSRPFA